MQIMLETDNNIEVLGARVHNLKNIDVTIPREKLVVITGLSGSGKSSLAFDTIYAEGQRRYVETFSAYARQFLGGLERPDVDKIDGLSPVIAIEQKTTSKSPRSTVGTITEIYDFLRLLYARGGDAYSYNTGEKMVSYNDDQIKELITKDFIGKRINILAPVIRARKGHYGELFQQIAKQGFLKVRVNGVEVVKLYCEPNGHFPHNPEPLKEHLGDICKLVLEEKADFGIVVDPDVDRLAFISNDGEMFGEEYTLVACADYVLSKTPGNTVSNMSSSRALRDITNNHNGNYQASAVGEVNVVELMKATNAIIGGEGNGGIIYPELHYGRDSLVGVALFLTYLANQDKTVAELRASYPQYYMSKNKIELTPQIDVDAILIAMTEKYKSEDITTIDGVKIDFPESWVHLRKSNTEPIIRIYTEAQTQDLADALALRIIAEIKAVAGI